MEIKAGRRPDKTIRCIKFNLWREIPRSGRIIELRSGDDLPSPSNYIVGRGDQHTKFIPFDLRTVRCTIHTISTQSHYESLQVFWQQQQKRYRKCFYAIGKWNGFHLSVKSTLTQKIFAASLHFGRSVFPTDVKSCPPVTIHTVNHT